MDLVNFSNISGINLNLVPVNLLCFYKYYPENRYSKTIGNNTVKAIDLTNVTNNNNQYLRGYDIYNKVISSGYFKIIIGYNSINNIDYCNNIVLNLYNQNTICNYLNLI